MRALRRRPIGAVGPQFFTILPSFIPDRRAGAVESRPKRDYNICISKSPYERKVASCLTTIPPSAIRAGILPIELPVPQPARAARPAPLPRSPRPAAPPRAPVLPDRALPEPARLRAVRRRAARPRAAAPHPAGGKRECSPASSSSRPSSWR